MVFRKRKTNPAVETGGTKRSISKRSIALIVFVLVAVAIGGAVLYEKSANNDAAKQSYKTDTCAPLYGEMKAAIDTQDFTKYKAVVDKVQVTSGFDKDQNCLYPLVDYYSVVGDAAKSRDYYTKLVVVYDKNIGFSGDIAAGAKPIESLEKQVKFSEKQLEEYKKGQPVNDFKRH